MSNCLPPSARFGELFAQVQQARLFPDSKTFADAVPKRPLAEILAERASLGPLDREGLRRFVTANFRLPDISDMKAPSGLSLDPHIRALWDMLVRSSDPCPAGSEIGLPEPFVVPGGRFRELYYWDSYFTMLGLARSGRQDLVEQMIVDFGSLLERFGHIPNGTRSYYLSRSHPPFFHLMVALSARQDEASRRQRLRWMRIEHDFWMDGAETLAPGQQHRRVARLPDGALLNRYWDDVDQPRDESWREDVHLAAHSAQAAQSLWRNLRAAAESGWDFSSRWLADKADLGSIRTSRILPVDLNCLLHGLETAIAAESAALGEPEFATVFERRAEARATALSARLWNDAGGFYADFDLDTGTASPQLTAAAAFPLFFRMADPRRAVRSTISLKKLLRPGGLMTTLVETGQQWDAPNGWAPLQWIAVAGLSHYGENWLAGEIAQRWLSMVEESFAATGQLFEKYDVERRTAGGGGEYGTVTGFGWTNGVTQELLAL
jgi:alpha,alpha-trehalase